MSRLVTAVSTGLQSLIPFNSIADPMRLHLLIRRLNDGPSDAWAKSDILLLRAFSVPFAQPILRLDVRSVLALLKEEKWGEGGQNLRVSEPQKHLIDVLSAYIHRSLLPHIYKRPRRT